MPETVNIFLFRQIMFQRFFIFKNNTPLPTRQVWDISRGMNSKYQNLSGTEMDPKYRKGLMFFISIIHV